MKTLLTVRPYYDLTTHYLSYWCGSFIKQFKESHNIVDLKDKRANKKEFTSVINKIQPLIIIINGHGNDSVITGQDNQLLIAVGINDELTKGRIIYAISCKSASKLGASCVKKGAIAFIGYKEDFIFVTTKEKETKPLDDKRASLFLEPSNRVMIALSKGYKPQEAHNQSKKHILKNIQDIITKSPSEGYLVSYLLWNYQHQVCLE